MEKVNIEFLLMALGHNLRKMAKRLEASSLFSVFSAKSNGTILPNTSSSYAFILFKIIINSQKQQKIAFGKIAA